MKVRNKFFIGMINRGYINEIQVDIFVKCLKLVLVYNFFYKSKPEAARIKPFKPCVDSKALTLKP